MYLDRFESEWNWFPPPAELNFSFMISSRSIAGALLVGSSSCCCSFGIYGILLCQVKGLGIRSP